MVNKGDWVLVLRNDVGALLPNGERFLKENDVVKIFSADIKYIYYVVKGRKFCDYLPIKDIKKIKIIAFIKKSKLLTFKFSKKFF